MLSDGTDDDIGRVHWLKIRILDSPTGLPRKVRLRSLLKCMLRQWSIRVERMPNELPADEIGPQERT